MLAIRAAYPFPRANRTSRFGDARTPSGHNDHFITSYIAFTVCAGVHGDDPRNTPTPTSPRTAQTTHAKHLHRNSFSLATYPSIRPSRPSTTLQGGKIVQDRRAPGRTIAAAIVRSCLYFCPFSTLQWPCLSYGRPSQQHQVRGQ